MSTKQPEWWFPYIPRRGMRRNPANTEFFAGQDVADRLVREAIQNSLDASSGLGPVEVEFRFVEVDSDVARVYLDGLWPHLEAQLELEHALPSRELEQIPFLLVEDYGTTGLTGPLNPDNGAAVEDEEANYRLFWFFKNDGRTSKSGDKLGSFGIGKTVFPYSSRINAFFGCTTRQADNGCSSVFLGQSQLKLHRLADGREREAYGFFAYREGSGEDEYEREIGDAGRVQGIANELDINRGADQAGLSISIPFPEQDLNCSTILQAVVMQFFMPIMRGGLVVTVSDREGRTVLEADTLHEEIDRLGFDAAQERMLHRHLGLTQRILDPEGEAPLLLNRSSEVRQPKFDDSVLSAANRKQLGERFIGGQVVSVRVPVPIEQKKSGHEWSYVDIYLQYDPESTDRNGDLYLRENLTITKHSGQAGQPGLCAILMASDVGVRELLRASEDVSHKEWRRRNAPPKLNARYDRGPSKVSYVLSILPLLVDFLMSPDGEQPDRLLLAALLPTPGVSPLPGKNAEASEDAAGSTAGTDDGDGEPDELPDVDLPPGGQRQWLGERLDDEAGVRIRSNPKYQGEVKPMRVRFAYGLLDGRGFGRHRSVDFSLKTGDQLVVEATGATCGAVEDHTLEVYPTSSEYEVTVKGFLPQLALDYRVRTFGDTDEEEAND